MNNNTANLNTRKLLLICLALLLLAGCDNYSTSCFPNISSVPAIGDVPITPFTWLGVSEITINNFTLSNKHTLQFSPLPDNVAWLL